MAPKASPIINIVDPFSKPRIPTVPIVIKVLGNNPEIAIIILSRILINATNTGLVEKKSSKIFTTPYSFPAHLYPIPHTVSR